MRTLSEIRDSIRAEFVGNPTIIALYELTAGLPFEQQFSNASLEAALIDVFAIASHTIETLFSFFKADVLDTIALMKPHTLKWYQQKALRFRDGQGLIDDTDQYDDTGLTAQDIEALEVVKHAAAIEISDGSLTPLLRIKVAGESGGALTQLSAPLVSAIQAYFQEIKDAGVKLLVTSNPPDYYRATVEVQYDPLILASNGLHLVSSAEVVRDTVTAYLKSLPFNGEFSPQALQDAIQLTDGVKLCRIIFSQSKYAALPWEDTGVRYIPDSGHMKVYTPSDLTIIYTPYFSNI